MDKTTRRKLLKASYRGSPYKTSGKPGVKPKVIAPGKRRYDPFSLALTTTQVAKDEETLKKIH